MLVVLVAYPETLRVRAVGCCGLLCCRMLLLYAVATCCCHMLVHPVVRGVRVVYVVYVVLVSS